MKRLILLAGGALALFAITASAIDHQVVAMNTPNRHFEPATLTINVGDTVTFINDPGNPGFHNARSDADAVTQFRCANGCDGDGGNGDPDSSTWTATVTFPTAGTVGYYCEVHGGDGGIGMSGVITVAGGGAPAITVDPPALIGAADEGATATLPISIGNTGDADLDWTADTASTDCATPDVVPWLSVDPTSGTVLVGDPPAAVNVTLDATTLAPGVYNANVCVHSNDAANDPVAVPVEFTVNVSTADQIFTNGFDP